MQDKNTIPCRQNINLIHATSLKRLRGCGSLNHSSSDRNTSLDAEFSIMVVCS